MVDGIRLQLPIKKREKRPSEITWMLTIDVNFLVIRLLEVIIASEFTCVNIINLFFVPLFQ